MVYLADCLSAGMKKAKGLFKRGLEMIDAWKLGEHDLDIKDDKDKPRLSLVPPQMIEAVGIIRTYGNKKYPEDSYRQVEAYRYVDALMRHLVEYLKDHNSVDRESTQSKEDKSKEKETTTVLQIKNLRVRYSSDELAVIDNYLDILRWTRQKGKIADSVIISIYKEWEKHSISKVMYGLNVYIKNPKYHDKKENYCYGIIRNVTAEEIAKQPEDKPKPLTTYKTKGSEEIVW